MLLLFSFSAGVGFAACNKIFPALLKPQFPRGVIIAARCLGVGVGWRGRGTDTADAALVRAAATSTVCRRAVRGTLLGPLCAGRAGAADTTQAHAGATCVTPWLRPMQLFGRGTPG